MFIYGHWSRRQLCNVNYEIANPDWMHNAEEIRMHVDMYAKIC